MKNTVSEAPLILPLKMIEPANRVAIRARSLGNEQRWDVIDRILPLAGHILLVPANEAFSRIFPGGSFDSRARKGISSEALKTPVSEVPSGIANLWYSHYTSPAEEVSFGFLRSGTLSRYGEPDGRIREAATRGNAAQLFEAVTAVFEKRGQQSLLGAERKARLVSIDLQSPDSPGSDLEIEKVTTAEQARVLREWDGKQLVVQGNALPLEVTHLIIPTGEGTYSRNSGWVIPSTDLEKISTLVEHSLAHSPLHFKSALHNIVEEIQILIADERQGAATPEMRYALAARVVVLCTLSGAVSHFNCRSGKDRTGFLDVEVKFVAFQLARRLRGMAVSALGTPMLADEREAWKELLLLGGNHEIQKLNTGVEGSKLDHGLLKDRVGEDLWRIFLGQGSIAHV